MTDKNNRVLELRNRAGITRDDFCEYFGIPYRTVQDWELGNRKAPDYLVRLMEFRLRMEKVIQ